MDSFFGHVSSEKDLDSKQWRGIIEGSWRWGGERKRKKRDVTEKRSFLRTYEVCSIQIYFNKYIFALLS